MVERKRKRVKSRTTTKGNGEGKNISRFSLESIEESSESASPGQRLCHLIGYVEQFILFFPTTHPSLFAVVAEGGKESGTPSRG